MKLILSALMAMLALMKNTKSDQESYTDKCFGSIESIHRANDEIREQADEVSVLMNANGNLKKTKKWVYDKLQLKRIRSAMGKIGKNLSYKKIEIMNLLNIYIEAHRLEEIFKMGPIVKPFWGACFDGSSPEYKEVESKLKNGVKTAFNNAAVSAHLLKSLSMVELEQMLQAYAKEKKEL